jgi:hypothetical protein
LKQFDHRARMLKNRHLEGARLVAQGFRGAEKVGFA